MRSRLQGSASYPITFLMVDSADHVTGKTGLTPSVALSKNGGAFGAAVGAVTELANGWYSWAASASDRDTLGELAIHISADGADPTDLLYVIVEYDPFDVAEAGDAMVLTAAYDAAKTATTAQQVWEYVTRTLTSSSGITAQDVWEYATRTLTQAAVSSTADITAGNLAGIRGDELSFSLTGLGSLANYTAIYFTAKTDQNLPDSSSTIQIVKRNEDEGLLYLNGETTTALWGSITIDDSNAGDITIGLAANASALLSIGTTNYDIQIVRSSGTIVSTLAVGKLSIIEDQTRSIA